MTATLAALWRYPVKAFPGQALQSVTVTTDSCLPGDRLLAFGDSDSGFDAQHPAHLKKQRLIALLQHAALAGLRWQAASTPGYYCVVHADLGSVEFDPEGDCEPLCRLLETLLQEAVSPPVVPVRAKTIHFTDLPQPRLSLLNLNSVRDLAKRLNRPIDAHRFRANLWCDGIPAWQEHTWLGRQLRFGNVLSEADRITDRCTAINVNPDSGQRDTLLQDMKRLLGHIDLGVYLRVIDGGELRVNSPLILCDR